MPAHLPEGFVFRERKSGEIEVLLQAGERADGDEVRPGRVTRS